MQERKKEIAQKMNEFQAAIGKTMDIFGKENYGQMVTQWNFTSLRQVLDGAVAELRRNVEGIIQGYEEELQKCREIEVKKEE